MLVDDERHVLPRSEGSYAVGRSFFEFVLRRRHGIKAAGLALARDAQRALGEHQEALEAQAKDLALAPDLPATIAYLQRRHPAASRLVETYEEQLRTALESVEALGLPAPPSVARPLAAAAPAFAHVDTAAAAFEPLALLGRPEASVLVVPIERDLDRDTRADRLAEQCNYLVQLRALREGFPGKLLHFTFATRASSRIRRLLRSPATTEGWGLFALELAHTHGCLKNPRLLAMYHLERLRSALLAVLDVRMHLQALDFDEALAQLRTVGHYRPAAALAVARRLAHAPTEGVAAFVGHAALRALYDELAQARAERFKPADFCERVLRMGGAPVAAIRAALLR